MKRAVLFIHGAGNPRAPEGSGGLLDDLRARLGGGHDVRAPDMPDPDQPTYEAWGRAIDAELARLPGDALVVGHSLGASMLLKCLALRPAPPRPLAGLFLVATPYWGTDEDWKLEYALPDDVAARLPPIGRLVLYHSRDDDQVPHAHLGLYAATLPAAITRTIEGREHAFTRGLPVLVDDLQHTP